MRARFSEAQILGFLREAAAGTPVMDLCWNHCFSRSTFRAWKAKYGAAITVVVRRRAGQGLDSVRDHRGSVVFVEPEPPRRAPAK